MCRFVLAEGIVICGIFGAAVVQAGKKWDIGIIRALSWANRERGTDSLGFFDSTGKMTKGAGDPSSVLCKKRVKTWLHRSQQSCWFVAGHTRFATRGKVNRRNSHPFRYGRIVGSHNGMCEAPAKFQVDSEHLFWALNKERSNYQKALEYISGYWGLSWYDGEHFYLMCYSGELAYDIINGVLYYSSSWSHLDSCTGGDSDVVKDGQVIRISADGTVANSNDVDSPVKAFESKISATPHNSRYGIYSGYWDGDDEKYVSSSNAASVTRSHHLRNYGTGRRGDTGQKASGDGQHGHDTDGHLSSDAVVRDYDTEWQSAWAEYCSLSAHSMSDEEHEEQYAG
jgi:hypothetical protein